MSARTAGDSPRRVGARDARCPAARSLRQHALEPAAGEVERTTFSSSLVIPSPARVASRNAAKSWRTRGVISISSPLGRVRPGQIRRAGHQQLRAPRRSCA